MKVNVLIRNLWPHVCRPIMLQFEPDNEAEYYGGRRNHINSLFRMTKWIGRHPIYIKMKSMFIAQPK